MLGSFEDTVDTHLKYDNTSQFVFNDNFLSSSQVMTLLSNFNVFFRHTLTHTHIL
jgi:hypothetical protein